MLSSLDKSPSAMLQFWLGLAIILAPIGIRMFHLDLPFGEALGLSLLAGEALFLVSAIGSSIQNNAYDILLHYRTASDILTTAHLFTPNSLLPVSPQYPGLEIVTTALVYLTDLPILLAGSLVVFTARWILISALILIFHWLTRSAHAAGIGCLIYMGSSTFFSFDTQFAYESLSLPLTLFVLWLVLKRSSSSQAEASQTNLAILAGMMVVMTHHVMSYFMEGMLLLGTAIAGLKRWKKKPGVYSPLYETGIIGSGSRDP